MEFKTIANKVAVVVSGSDDIEMIYCIVVFDSKEDAISFIKRESEEHYRYMIGSDEGDPLDNTYKWISKDGLHAKVTSKFYGPDIITAWDYCERICIPEGD